jgi:menaquinone-dependent protoporphyrinogen oxidase
VSVLVVYSTRHGATEEIARSIGEAIRAELLLDGAGHDPSSRRVLIRDADLAPAPGAFDAVVVGSSVYMGRWLHPARAFIDDNASTLAGLPLWLFSSGPLGTEPRPHEPPADIAEIVDVMPIQGSEVFGGRLDRERLPIAERAVAAALRAPSGDFRDWNAIRAWGESIGRSLASRPVPVPVPVPQVRA